MQENVDYFCSEPWEEQGAMLGAKLLLQQL